ncbi:MAG: hypothetical protein ACKO27_05500 [Ilumatobacteraceae bacterium]
MDAVPPTGDAPPAYPPPAAPSALPAPPAPAPSQWAARLEARRLRHRRPGDLAPGWASSLAVGWLVVVLGLGAVWVSSRTTGLSTWWIGPEARPASVFVSMLPFVLPLAVVIGVLAGARRIAWLGIAAALATAAVGVGDLGRVEAYGIVELVLACGGLLVSLAAFTGTYRRDADRHRDGDPADDTAGR